MYNTFFKISPFFLRIFTKNIRSSVYCIVSTASIVRLGKMSQLQLPPKVSTVQGKGQSRQYTKFTRTVHNV